MASRIIDMGEAARAFWGEEWGKPETVYQFSNDRKFVDPSGNHGIYAQDGSFTPADNERTVNPH